MRCGIKLNHLTPYQNVLVLKIGLFMHNEERVKYELDKNFCEQWDSQTPFCRCTEIQEKKLIMEQTQILKEPDLTKACVCSESYEGVKCFDT